MSLTPEQLLELPRLEAAILASEGPHHVSGRYYANAFDADRQRRWLAERLARRVAPAIGASPQPSAPATRPEAA